MFLATLPCDILSGFLVFCDRVVYPVFLSLSPRSFGLSALEDQQCAGALMWTCVTVVYLIRGSLHRSFTLAPSIRRSCDSAIRLATHRGTAHGSEQDEGGLRCHNGPHLPSCPPLRCNSAILGDPGCSQTTGRSQSRK
ncbi:MAG: hypothetical protein ACLPHI_10470 [Terriglobales bacterium]